LEQNQKSQDNLAWLIRSFKKMHDILHDTPIYQLILEEGREKGLEEGRAKLENAQKEERLNLRLILVNIVQARFPDLVDRVKAHTDAIEDITVLRQLAIKLGTAQERETILQSLIADHKATH